MCTSALQFVLGSQGGMPANAKSVVHACEILLPSSTWGVVERSVGFLHLAILGLEKGGHIHAGLEASICYSEGRLATSNADLVPMAKA